MLNKTLLGSAAVIMAVAGAQAADLPSKKAAPATYVKICDAYGAGFFFIPGTDTCVKLGGYTRFEAQYTPTKDILKPTTAGVAPTIGQYAKTEDNFGTEYRGRLDVDARTSTSMGVARSFISLRGTGTTGLRGTTAEYVKGNVGPSVSGDNKTLVMERAFVQWAGFTAGIATSNYAFIPSMTYTANLWSGYPNGQRQLSYTAVFGGGFSATLAVEEKSMNNGDAGSTSINKYDTANILVGNVRLDQSWGFAALHGMLGKNSIANAVNNASVSGTNTALAFGPLSSAADYTIAQGSNIGAGTTSAYAIGATTLFNLDMITKGDKIWLTANYTSGILGAITANPIGQPNVTSSGGRVFGGVLRNDSNVVYLGNNTFANTKAWNVGAQALHYWDPKWRSMLTAAYVKVLPPTQQQTTALTWGDGTIWETRGSMIYSPVKDFDIGLEVQYMKNSSKLQNTGTVTGTWATAGYNGLSNSNVTTKLRVERAF